MFLNLNSNETRLFETFSTYKIFTLELISIFCSLRKNKLKNAQVKIEDTEEKLTGISSLPKIKENDLTSVQELRIINVVLKSIKTTDLEVNAIIDTLIKSSTNNQTFLKILNDRIESISKNSLLEIRNLINDLKIYFIGPTLNDSLIKPWSVVGKYVRRCIIIYEKTSFEELVSLCKQARYQFEILSASIAKKRQNSLNPQSCDKTEFEEETESKANENTATHKPHMNIYSDAQMPHDQNYDIDTSSSPTNSEHFLNDESNLTITSEFINRSTNVDCSGMDLESLETKLNNQNRFNIKALTSTVSHRRHQQNSNFKSKSNTDSEFTHEDKIDESRESISMREDDSLANKLNETTPSVSRNEVPFLIPLQSAAADNKLLTEVPSETHKLIKEKQFLHKKQFEPSPYATTITNSCAFSRKTAEFFVAQQAHLIENNEYEAMNPFDLNKKIDELILYDPSFSDAYFLKYLNYMRLKDYPSSLKALHDYFDRILLAGSVSLAALNLSSLEYRFDNKENALFALKEAITSAHHEGDNICLQHCLSWLYKMDTFNNIGNMIRKNFLIKSACSRTISNELYANVFEKFKKLIFLPLNKSLASYNLNYFARTNIGKHKPDAILNLLNKTDIVNLKMNSKMEHNLLNQCHKAALWNLYGQRKLSILHSQMLLNLLPKSHLYKLNTESQCIAMCFLALEFSRNGMFGASQNILNYCKEIFSLNTKISEHWLYAESLIFIEKNLLSGNWSMSKNYIEKMASINIQQAYLQEMNIFIVEGNLEKAKEIGNKILKRMNMGFIESTKMNNYTNNFYESDGFNGDSTQKDFNTKFEFWNEQMSMSLRMNYINIYIALREYPNALILAIKFYNDIKQLDFNYELMTSCLVIAKILIHMEYPEQAIKYVEKCIIFILSNGSLLDQAKLHYLYAKCLHMLEKNKNFDIALAHMVKCVEKLEAIEGSIYLVSAYAYISLLLNESGHLSERNKYAFKFRQLRKKLPLIGYLL